MQEEIIKKREIWKCRLIKKINYSVKVFNKAKEK